MHHSENWQGESEAAVKIVNKYTTPSVNLLPQPYFAIHPYWLKLYERQASIYVDPKTYLPNHEKFT